MQSRTVNVEGPWLSQRLVSSMLSNSLIGDRNPNQKGVFASNVEGHQRLIARLGGRHIMLADRPLKFPILCLSLSPSGRQ